MDASNQMLRITLIIVLFNGINTNMLAQEKVLVTGTAEIPALNTDKTGPQYEAEVCEMARNKAVEKEFRTSVLSNYEKIMYTEMEGRSVGVHSDVRHDYLNTFPNGIWISDIEKPEFTQYKKDDIWWMKCSVKGYARKIEATRVEFVAKTMDGTDFKKDETVDFINGESGYLYFRSPEEGYLIVFFDDLDKVFRCIPYNQMTKQQMEVRSNHDYIFFSQQFADYVTDPNLIDEVEFYTEKKVTYNQFYLLFSPKPFPGYLYKEGKQLKDGYSTFKSMSREDFHKWLQEERIRNKELQVQRIGITIKK